MKAYSGLFYGQFFSSSFFRLFEKLISPMIGNAIRGWLAAAAPGTAAMPPRNYFKGLHAGRELGPISRCLKHAAYSRSLVVSAFDMRQPQSRVHVSLLRPLQLLPGFYFLSFMLFFLCLSLSIHPLLSYSLVGPVNSPTAGGVVITITGPIVQPFSFTVGLTSCSSLTIVSVDSVACRVAAGTGAGLNITAYTQNFPSYFSYDAPILSKCSSVSAAGGILHLTGSNFGTSQLMGHRALRTKVSGIEVSSRWLSDTSLMMMAPTGAGRMMDLQVRLHPRHTKDLHPACCVIPCKGHCRWRTRFGQLCFHGLAESMALGSRRDRTSFLRCRAFIRLHGQLHKRSVTCFRWTR